MLPSTPARGFRPTSGRPTRWRDAEDHFDAVVIDLNPADDGMDDLTHAEPVELVQTVTHLGGKIFQSADDEVDNSRSELAALIAARFCSSS